ncbi:sigma-70 family RNA polymerase sigma factor [Candidatus Cloacimonadota bacterium]
MELTDKEIQNFYKISFDYALYKTSNVDAAEEISSETISLFLLSYKTNTNIRRWIINTTKNYCKKYFAKSSNQHKNAKKYRADLIEKITPNNIENNMELNNAFKEAFESISDQELNLILYYFQCNESIKMMHENLDISYDALRKQMSRLKQKIKAETNLRLGFIGSKRIVTPQLNNLIIKFIKRFKENLENDTINKMYYYFSEIDIKKYNESFDIKKVFDYDIELNESIYKVWVFFEDKNQNIDSFFIEFYVDNNNHLKIITPPTRTKKVIVIEPDSSEGQMLKELINQFPIDKTGHPKIPKEELEKIIKQFEEKQKKS